MGYIQPMHLDDEQIHRLATRMLRQLRTESLVELKASETDVAQAIEGALHAQLTASHEVNQQVRKLMAQYSNQMSSGSIDTQQMYTMIRKQVAKEMKFEMDPEEQINVVAHRIHDRIYNDDLIDYTDEDKALRSIKATLNETLRAEDRLDDQVRAKIQSLKRNVPEGSAEWDTLYHKYMDEELGKHQF